MDPCCPDCSVNAIIPLTLGDQGFGVRTVSGDRTSFAFSDTISQKTLREAVKNTLAISRTSTEKKKSIYLDGNKNRPKFGRVGSLYDYGNPVDAMSSQEKVELLQKIETLAKKKDPRISQVMASISGSFSIVVIVTDRGLITDLRPLVRLSVTAVAEEKTRKEFGVSLGYDTFFVLCIDWGVLWKLFNNNILERV